MSHCEYIHVSEVDIQHARLISLNKDLKDENQKLKEGHELIYKSLRDAEGVGELMTGPEYECVAESVNHYIHGYHNLTDENEKLKEELEESEKDVRAWRGFSDEYCEAYEKKGWENKDLKEENLKIKKEFADFKLRLAVAAGDDMGCMG